jgi:hypothetical protein
MPKFRENLQVVVQTKVSMQTLIALISAAVDVLSV